MGNAGKGGQCARQGNDEAPEGFNGPPHPPHFLCKWTVLQELAEQRRSVCTVARDRPMMPKVISNRTLGSCPYRVHKVPPFMKTGVNEKQQLVNGMLKMTGSMA